MIERAKVTAGQLVEELLGQGRYTFVKEEALRRLGGTPQAAYMALYRLMKAGRLFSPRSGFYVIVDAQHRPMGALPPEWFIDSLMKDMGRPYYVGLLSAAQIHGAAHHHPQEFQVVIPRRADRPIRKGNLLIRFHGKGLFDRSQTMDVKTTTGYMKTSTPETTAWDLVRYHGSAGGLDNVITLLSELAETLDAAKLRDTVKRHGEVLVAQRLGYLLDLLGRQDLTKGFAGWVDDAPLRRLDPSSPPEEAPAKESRKWRLTVNAQLEPEA